MEKKKYTGDLTDLIHFWSKEEAFSEGVVNWVGDRFPKVREGYLPLATIEGELVVDLFNEAVVILEANKQFKGVAFSYQGQLLYVNRGESVEDLYKLWEVTSRL